MDGAGVKMRNCYSMDWDLYPQRWDWDGILEGSQNKMRSSVLLNYGVVGLGLAVQITLNPLSRLRKPLFFFLYILTSLNLLQDLSI